MTIGTNSISNRRDQSSVPEADDVRREEAAEDLKHLALLSFVEQTGLTPLDTLFDSTAEATKTDAKVRHII